MQKHMTIFLLFILVPGSTYAKKWKDSTGRYTVDAKLAWADSANVGLVKNSGTIITVPRERLGAFDQYLLDRVLNRRVWKVEKGNNHLGTLKKLNKDSVLIRRLDGRLATIPRSTLTDEDAQLVEDVFPSEFPVANNVKNFYGMVASKKAKAAAVDHAVGSRRQARFERGRRERESVAQAQRQQVQSSDDAIMSLIKGLDRASKSRAGQVYLKFLSESEVSNSSSIPAESTRTKTVHLVIRTKKGKAPFFSPGYAIRYWLSFSEGYEKQDSALNGVGECSFSVPFEVDEVKVYSMTGLSCGEYRLGKGKTTIKIIN